MNAPQSTLPVRGRVFAELGVRTGRVLDRLRLVLGLKRTQVAGGVRYTERSTESLRRSLSRTGTGLKEYDAAFPDGARMRLHCTPGRAYGDLSGAVLLPRYRLVEDLLSPGMRVLELSCGTGYGAAWLMEAVGPSGAVVALDRDRESIKYAQNRYKGNAAFEVGGVETLYGELAGSFNAVLALRGLETEPSLEMILTELWRVVAPGGWLMVAEPAGLDEKSSSGAGSGELEQVLRRVIAGVAVASDGEAAERSSSAATAEEGVASVVRRVQDPLPERRSLWLAMKAAS